MASLCASVVSSKGKVVVVADNESLEIILTAQNGRKHMGRLCINNRGQCVIVSFQDRNTNVRQLDLFNKGKKQNGVCNCSKSNYRAKCEEIVKHDKGCSLFSGLY